MGSGCRSWAFIFVSRQLFLLVGVFFCWWQLFLLVGIPLHSWVFGFVCGWLALFMGGWLHLWAFISMWWYTVAGLVDVSGSSWCSHVVGGSVVMGHCGYSFMVVGCHLSLWVV